MKQGIDPNTHLSISETQVKEERNNCADRQPNTNGEPEVAFQMNNSTSYINGGHEFTEAASRETSMSKPVVCDPLVEFQAGVDPIGYNSNLLTQYQQTQFESNQT